LVVEYGEFSDSYERYYVPYGSFSPYNMSDFLSYTSTPQSSLANRSQGLVTGSVVGGGSVMNGMTFHRGSAPDYDSWEQLGNPGWGWKGLLPYFKKAIRRTLHWEDTKDWY